MYRSGQTALRPYTDKPGISLENLIFAVNKRALINLRYILVFLFCAITVQAQKATTVTGSSAKTKTNKSETITSDSTKTKPINIVHGANFTKDERRFPGASIFSKDDRQVQFEHEGADLFCDVAIYYQQDKRIRALGNVRLEQGDSLEMTSGKINYDGKIKLAKAFDTVLLKNNKTTLKTDTLYFDRAKQESYYQDKGTIIDSANTLTSRIGRYFMELKKLQFLDSVHINNPEYTVDSERLDYYETSKNAYMYGPSTITGKTYKFYFERGYYNTTIERGYGIKNTRIDYNNRIVRGDSVFFDKASAFASATNNITVTDTVNNSVVRAHYAEVFKEKDSVFATKRAVSISLVEQDSLYMHGDTLMVTGKPENRIIRAFRNAKFYKTDLSGKSDSIHSEEKTGITQLIKNPVLWNGENQMTGDSIHLLSSTETEQLDSLKVLQNAFIISLDSVSMTGYNQAKGINLYGKFVENELKIIDLVQNTEVIYYMYNDDDDLIGINKTTCSKIRITMADSDIADLTFFTTPEGDIFPEIELPPESRKLKGFKWRGDERILTKYDIFDKDDNTITLPVIRGIDNPIDFDAEEEQRALNASDPINRIPVLTPTPSKPKQESTDDNTVEELLNPKPKPGERPKLKKLTNSTSTP